MEKKGSGINAISDAARSWLQRILSGMGIASEIEVLNRDNTVVLNALCGEDSQIAIGRKGQTLEAIQFLVNLMVRTRDAEAVGTRVMIDIQGYRERRRLNLIDMAQRKADQVFETGEPVCLAALNPYERHLVHSALKNDSRVTSCSRGEGHMKQILIAPAAHENPADRSAG